jgi:hypothetical protein
VSRIRHVFLALSSLALAACSDEDVPPPGAASSTGTPGACPAELVLGLEPGDPVGHTDPLGAASAGEARAGRIADVTQVPQPAHGRQRIEQGDYLLANDKVAFVIEAKDESDGYATFGGELLSVDRIGPDGLPLGRSYYIETLMGISNEMIDPTSVGVIADGQGGGPAVVRVLGNLRGIPFLDESLKPLFPGTYGYPAAMDWVLAPGAEKVDVRFYLLNPTNEVIDLGIERAKQTLHGFFHYSQNQLVTEEVGYADPEGPVAWVGFDAGPSSFVWRTPGGPIEFGITQSGFSLFWGPGFAAEACAVTEVPFLEVIAGEAGFDGLRETVRRVDGLPAWRAITGVVRDGSAAPVAGAWVHELDADGKYLSRTRTAEDGTFTIHAPAETVRLVPQLRGLPASDGLEVADGETDVELVFAPDARLHVVATEAGSGKPLPVRVQVIPVRPQPATPDAYGVLDEQDGRLHQAFVTSGEATLRIPPGDHRVIVSRGYEYELLDTAITAAPGETVEVNAPLEHSVDTTGAMCADFHIHSFYSADSNDPVEHKVRGAIADGLDIPVSSEHEWVIDFQPIVESLGLTQWAFGVPSEELTTFAWGHFGVVPLVPDTSRPNNGAVPWVGHKPSEVFAMVRERDEAPALIVNHPSGGGFGAYFSSAGFDRALGAGTNTELWSDDFDAVEVFNDSDFEANRDDSVADWFALLNKGYDVWALGSSDSHHLRSSPVGYPRTCMWLGHDDPTRLSPSIVRDGILSGNSTISGGLYMMVRGPSGEMPGGAVAAGGGPVTFTVTVRAPSWIAADTLETIVNGETVSNEALLPLGEGTGKTFVNEVTLSEVPGARRTWVVFHAKGESDLTPLHPGRRPFAASNPIFIQ